MTDQSTIKLPPGVPKDAVPINQLPPGVPSDAVPIGQSDYIRPTPQIGFDPNQQGMRASDVENTISNRPSFIDVNNPITADSFQQHPIKESLRGLGGGLEVAEGVPADIALGLQDATRTSGKSVVQIPSDIFKTLKGERPAQFGDVYRKSNTPILSDENLGGTGISVPAIGGLLSASHEFTPSGAAGNAIGKVAMKIGQPVFDAMKPGIGRVMSALSGVPETSMTTALNNPNVLSGKYLKEEGKASGNQYEKTIKPLINDVNASVPSTSGTNNLINKLGLYTPSGASTRALSTMSKPEQDMVLDWAKRLDNGSGKINFNEAHKVIGEADSELGRFYKARQAGALANLPSDSFTNAARIIRGTADEALKSGSAPEVGETIGKSADYFKGNQANQDFNKFFPKHTTGKAMIDFLVSKIPHGIGLPLASGLAVASSPMAQKMAIQGMAGLGNLTGKNGAILINAIKAMKNQSSS